MKSVFPWKGKPRLPKKETPGTIVEHLKRVDVLKDLTHDEVETLFHGMVVRDCTQGTVFFMPEDSTERLFVLKTGHADLYRLTAGGKRLVTRHLEPGVIFGELGLMGQSMQGCFAEATEDSLVCIATKDDVLGLLRDRPAVALRLLEAMGNRLKALEQRMELLAFSPVKVRLANFIVSNADVTTGMMVGYTHEEIGDMIGALRQTVTEALGEMERQGLIQVEHKRLMIRDRAGLERLASEVATPRE